MERKSGALQSERKTAAPVAGVKPAEDTARSRPIARPLLTGATLNDTIEESTDPQPESIKCEGSPANDHHARSLAEVAKWQTRLTQNQLSARA